MLKHDSSQLARLHDRAVAQELSVAAMGNCLAGEFGLAEEQFREVLRLDPARWSDGIELGDLARRYIMVDAQRSGYDAATRLMQRMFAMLGQAVPGFGGIQRATRGHVNIEMAFLARQRGARWPVLRHALCGLWLAPQWARNRGVWSIMARVGGGRHCCVSAATFAGANHMTPVVASFPSLASMSANRHTGLSWRRDSGSVAGKSTTRPRRILGHAGCGRTAAEWMYCTCTTYSSSMGTTTLTRGCGGCCVWPGTYFWRACGDTG